MKLLGDPRLRDADVAGLGNRSDRLGPAIANLESKSLVWSIHAFHNIRLANVLLLAVSGSFKRARYE